jgi:hypothetical protein
MMKRYFVIFIAESSLLRLIRFVEVFDKTVQCADALPELFLLPLEQVIGGIRENIQTFFMSGIGRPVVRRG